MQWKKHTQSFISSWLCNFSALCTRKCALNLGMLISGASLIQIQVPEQWQSTLVNVYTSRFVGIIGAT